MAQKCETREAAEVAARDFYSAGATQAAVVEILRMDLLDQPQGISEWWAVKNPDDLDTVPGLVTTVTLVRGRKRA